MRNTFIALGIAVIIILGYLSLKAKKDTTTETTQPVPPIASDSSKAAVSSSQATTPESLPKQDKIIEPAKHSIVRQKDHSQAKRKERVAKNDRNTYQGDANEGSVSEHGFETQGTRKAQGASGNLAKIEDLTSIYPQSQQDPSTESLNNNKKPPVIAGVPIQSWVLSERNSLSNVSVPEARDMGLKVYYWCMELRKKHFEYTGVNRCKSILESQHEERVAAHFRGQPG